MKKSKLIFLKMSAIQNNTTSALRGRGGTNRGTGRGTVRTAVSGASRGTGRGTSRGGTGRGRGRPPLNRIGGPTSANQPELDLSDEIMVQIIKSNLNESFILARPNRLVKISEIQNFKPELVYL